MPQASRGPRSGPGVLGNALLIVNPLARQVAAQRDLPALAQQHLAEWGVETDLILTVRAGEATEVAGRAARQGYDSVVVLGGDGTANEVVNGLAGTSLALGVIPLGTGNVLGDCLGLTAGDMAGACRALAQGTIRPVDLGQVNGRYFVTMAGIGLDAQVAAETDGNWKSWLGKLAFVGQFLGTVAHCHPWGFEASVDGQPLSGEIWGAFACNTPRYTWRLRLVPEALDDDGQLDYVFLHGCRLGELQRVVTALFVRGEAAGHLPHMEVLRGQSLSLRTLSPAPWQVDGEVGGTTPVLCQAVPNGLQLVMPRSGG